VTIFDSVEANHLKTLYRAKTAKSAKKRFLYFSELGVLCVFARAMASYSASKARIVVGSLSFDGRGLG
jgi:hypothetical protein